MSNAPMLIGYKATYVKEAPFAGSGGYLSSSSISDAYTPEEIAFYEERGHAAKDVWAIYASPDRRTLLTVNLDGTLRSTMVRRDTSEPIPHPYWA
jgi:hypothetical protein